MEVKVTFRKAVAADLKQDSRTLKVGQTYAITQDGGKTVNGIYAIKGDEDPFILKYYLQHEWLLVPQNCPEFTQWMKDLESCEEKDEAEHFELENQQ